MGTPEKKSWVGKKEPTDPKQKEQHQGRRTKREIQHHFEDNDWNKQLQEYLCGNNIRILSKEQRENSSTD